MLCTPWLVDVSVPKVGSIELGAQRVFGLVLFEVENIRDGFWFEYRMNTAESVLQAGLIELIVI